MAIKREEENKMKKQMTPAEIELARQSFAKLAFGVEYNEGGSLDLLQIARCVAAAATRPIR